VKKQVKNNVFWVGKVDWELRKFHGDEYSTHKGSTYNSYLIQEEKTVLIDTVPGRLFILEGYRERYTDSSGNTGCI
jgi:flavorubredoxin